MAALSTPLRRTVGVHQIALAVIIMAVAGLLAWYLAAIWFDLAPWLRGWKEYPDGWSWRLLETVPPWDRFITAALGLSVIAGALWLIRISNGVSRRGMILRLVVLVVGVHLLQVGTLGLKLSSPHALLVQRVLDENFTGYFQAAQTVESPTEFFTDWRRLMNACGHCTSHPTGASAFYWPMISLAERIPPEAAQSTAGWLQEVLRLRVRNVDAASVIAGVLDGHLILLLAAISVVPFYALGRLVTGTARGGALTAGLVGTMPGLILMSPELDQLYVLIGGVAMVALMLGLRSERWVGQMASGAACGLSVALGLLFTWGLLVWIPLLLCLAFAYVAGLHVYEGSHEVGPGSRLKRATVICSAALIGLVLPYAMLGTFTPYDVRDVAREGLAHYQTFEAISRPGGAIWLFHGPLDTTQFIGLPLTFASLAVIVASAGKAWLPMQSSLSERLGRINVYTVALAGIVGVTFLGSYMKAESGRQLLFIMPLAAVSVAAGVRAGSQSVRPWHWALIAAQALVTVTIGARWITP